MKNVLLVVEINDPETNEWSWLSYLDGQVNLGGEGRFSAKDLFLSIKRRGIMDLCVMTIKKGPAADAFLEELEKCGAEDPWPKRPQFAWNDVDLCPYLTAKKAGLLRRFITLYGDIWSGEEWEAKIQSLTSMMFKLEDGEEPTLEDRKLVKGMLFSLLLSSKLRSHDEYVWSGLEEEFQLKDDERLLED